MRKIPMPEMIPRSERWDHMRGPDLVPLDQPCHGCAVTTGLYIEISADLATEPLERQIALSKKWSCHNHPGRACRGNWNYLRLDKPKALSEEKDYAHTNSL